MVNPTPSTPLLNQSSTRVPRQAILWKAGAAFAAAGVVTGAFGAHGLRNRAGITPDQIHAWETGAHYAMYNGLAMMLTSLHPRFATHRFAGPAIAAGGVLFSGSIFALVLARDRFKALGPVTPLGGMVMIAGVESINVNISFRAITWLPDASQPRALNKQSESDVRTLVLLPHLSPAVLLIAPIDLPQLSSPPLLNSTTMSEPAPAAPAPLTHSQSFSGTSPANLASTFAKRRFVSSTTLEFFAPAAKSFQPLPYTPHGIFSTSNTQTRTFTTRHSRPQDVLAPPGMDPLPTDPCVVFIHPPFTTFPDSEHHPDGLCYQILADNPEWFLDPRDFIHENNTNPHAVPYPPVLEPPRGWCPARKKDLKERGSEGWPEGEEPRLRCTFCRRTYAGVNAKSMWRRHVFEKHKVAMANRRDANERARGRGSGKENKTSGATSKAKEEPCDRLLNLEVAPELDPQANAEASPHTSQFRSAPPSSKNAKPKRARKKESSMTPDESVDRPVASGSGTSSVESEPEFADTLVPTHTPPHSPALQAQLIEDSIPILATPGLVPPSPYDPLSQPDFRHSPAPLPSDHPWRFPSPSHPLHSHARDIPLTMLAPSPLVKLPIPSGISPQSSPFSTPNASRSSDLKTPSTLGFSLKSGPRPWFFKDHLGSPLDRHSNSKSRLGSSPLSSSLRGTPAGQKRNISALSDDWFSDTVLGPDPFAALQSPWPSLSTDSSPRKSNRSLGDASPVLRNGSAPIDLGLGLGLLTPFSFTKRMAPTLEDIDAELEEMDNPGGGKVGGPSALRSLTDISLSGSPPLKKRRLAGP